MKLEPLKKAKLPKYAAALGILASAALLTGCGPQLAGDVANPNVDSNDIVVLDGEESVCTEPEETAAETDPAVTTTETTEYPLAEDGEAPVVTDDGDSGEPLMLEGDVAWIPDYQEAVDEINRFYGDVFGSYESGFAAKGYIMTRDETAFSHYGIRFTSVLKHQESGTRIAIYDGKAEDNGKTMREWMQEICTASYDWGCVLDYPADEAGWHRMIFVDMSRDIDSPVTDAEQIYKDVME